MGPVSEQYWSHECRIVLAPCEKKTVEIATEAKTPARRLVYLTAAAGGHGIRAASFNTLGAAGRARSANPLGAALASTKQVAVADTQ
jgi:hypothetical protein